MANIDVKEIIVKPINPTKANDFVRKHHYSGKIVNNSCLHFGAFYKDILHGVLSFGPSMDKSKIIGLVKDTKWNDFLELNRMAFDDYLPKNSESRCIAVSFKLIKKHYPNIKWVISFADGTQCGDGAIYRASGFSLCGITENKTILEFPNGERVANMSLRPQSCSISRLKELLATTDYKGGVKYFTDKEWEALGVKRVSGYMLRYIYFLDKSYKDKLTVPILPFSEIDKIGAGMYKGENITVEERHKKGVAELKGKR